MAIPLEGAPEGVLMSANRSIVLPDGTEYVTVEQIPGLIAAALYPGESDADLLARASAEEEHKRAVKRAILDGTLKSCNYARVLLNPSEAADFPDLARVAIRLFARYAVTFGCEVEVLATPPVNSSEWDGTDATPILERQVILGDGPLPFFQAHLRPVWGYWRNMAEVPLPQAVLLSLNVDGRLSIDAIEQNVARAESLRGESQHALAPLTAAMRRDALNDLRRKVEQRTAQCMSHIRSGTLPSRVTAEPGRQTSPSEHMVSLAEFRRWGEALSEPYTFPSEFPSATRSVNWPQWRALERVAVWEAVALSLRTEPDNRILDRLDDTRLDGETEDFKERLKFAARRFPRPELHEFSPAGRLRPYSWNVGLREFATFAIESGWQISSELASLAASPLPDSPVKPERQVTQRVQNGYLVTIGALLELLVTTTAGERRGYPSEASLISAILTKHRGMAGLSKRALEEKFAAAKRALNSQ